MNKFDSDYTIYDYKTVIKDLMKPKLFKTTQ